MSKPRGGRAGRGRGNGAHAQNNVERPTPTVYTRGQRTGNVGGAPRGGHNGFTSNNRTSTNTSADTQSRGHHANTTFSSLNSIGGANSTPFAKEDYQKRLQHIKAARPKLRQQFIKEGRMNPEGQMRLSDSVKLIGSCTDMCPEYERVRRIVEEDVKPPECTQETQHLPRKQRIPDESRMVKAYARSAAGMDVELVSEIRSPATCLKTLDYLMQRLDDDEFDFLHSWIWDRTRAIRKDLRTQRIEQRSDIVILLTCLERSARFLLLSTHQMARTTKEDYSHQQDIEQLNQTLMSLKERYVDNRRVGYPSENESEFWAYRLILAPLFTNTHLENEIHSLSSDLRHNRRVQTAIEIYRVLKSVILTKSSSFVQAQANWKRFWEIIKAPNVSYLMACAAEVSFQRVRHVVLDTVWRVYRMGTTTRPHTVETWTTDKLKDVLGFDTDAEAVKLCEAYGFVFNTTNEGRTFLDVTAKGFARTPLGLAADLSPQTFSRGIVEKKRYNRAFSAVVQAMSVREAQTHGLMMESTGEEWEDAGSLFVAEAPTAQPNIFAQASGTPSGISTNPFQPQSTSIATSGISSNPFIKPHLTSQPFPGSSPAGAQSGVFDVSKDTIKFAPSGPSSTPLTGSNKPNPFISTPPALQATSSTPSTNGTSPAGFNFFAQAAKAMPQQPAATPPAAKSSGFVFSGVSSSGQETQNSAPTLSFTPAGSPAPADPTLKDAEKQKVKEQEKLHKAEAEAKARAEVQRQRALVEQARQAKEAAEWQRFEAEQHRLRLQQEAQDRIVREARQRQEKEEQERMARIQARETVYNSLTTGILLDVEQGLMSQFVENMLWNVVDEVVEAAQEAKRRDIWERKKVLADAMYEQKQLGFKRLVMASWIAKLEKKKRAQKTRDRRQRLKKQRALMLNTENAATDIHTEATTTRLHDEDTFQKPKALASARRAKRTEERRVVNNSIPNGGLSTLRNPAIPEQHMLVQKALTPISMGHSQTSSLGYSEAYYKSTAPIDRTETDWFELRAQGIDPSLHRKRSFGSSSDEEKLALELKRPKMSPSTNKRHSQPASTTTITADHRARLDAIARHSKNFKGSTQAVADPKPDNGRSSLGPRVNQLLEKARQAISPRVTASAPKVQHDFGRSAPNLGLSTSSGRQSVLGKSVGTAATDSRPAYWARKSRFVPQQLYGQGPEAIRAYREQYGLNSPASTRPNSTEPLTVSSPVPTQQSYVPVNGYTQEQYSEEESNGIEVVDVDAEDENAIIDEEYDDDEEDQRHQCQTMRASGVVASWMSNRGIIRRLRI
ncbi:SAC3/GANP/Nin1/mts3/eIF-3 p25 family-domain-containing protein [Phaeosphaeriaceae sp. PMI808]|nr:SAC3/GANP/Nin1/mts3/eIF-3 p25 family-domain-containing protein [Phaeosphaeriaceae sp. PMI808]